MDEQYFGQAANSDEEEGEFEDEVVRPKVSAAQFVLHWVAVFSPVALTLILLAWGCGAFEGKEIEQDVFKEFSESMAEPMRKDLIKPYGGNYTEQWVTDELSKKDPKPLMRVDGAPKRFFHALFSDTQKLADCFGAPLLGRWNNGECQYVDMALNVSLFGVIIIPILLIIWFVTFTAVREMKNPRPWLRSCSCGQFGHKEPTMLYPPAWQILIFVLFFLFCLFVACVAVIGLAAVSHYEFGMSKAREGVELAETIEQTTDAATLALIADETAKATATLSNTNQLLDDGVQDLRNGVLLDLTQELQVLYSELLGMTDFIEGGSSPACTTSAGAPRPCPDCFACHRAIEAVSAQLAWLADAEGEYVSNLTRHFVLEDVRPAIARALRPIDESAEVLGNHTKLLANVSAAVRGSSEDEELTYTVVAAVFWGLTLLAACLALAAAILGSLLLWRIAFWLAALLAVGSWVLWGVLAVVVVPHGGLCDALPTLQAGEENEIPAGDSTNLFATMEWPSGEDPRFRLLFDSCVLNARGNVWTSLGVPESDVTQLLLDWDLNRILPREMRESNLNIIARFSEYDEAMVELLAVRAEDVGYNASCVPGLCQKAPQYQEFLTEFNQRRSQMSDMAEQLQIVLLDTSQASNVHRAALSKAQVDVSDTLKSTVDAILAHGTCEPYAALYAGIRDPLCLGANVSLGALWAALLLASFAWLPLLCLLVHSTKHSRQRVRDARHPALNLEVMFKFTQFKMVKRWRWREVQEVREKLQYRDPEDKTGGREGSGSRGALTTLGKGVDGWGHDCNYGNIPERELEPTLFQRKPVSYSMMDYHMIKGKMELDGLHKPHRVPRIDRHDLIQPNDPRDLELDKKSGKLRWAGEKGRRRRSSVVGRLIPIQRAAEVLYDHMLTTCNQEESKLPTEILKLFKQTDTDGSGTIDRNELKRGLENRGMEPTREEVNLLMKTFDASNCGLLDFNDFKRLILSGKDGHEAVEKMMGLKHKDTIQAMNTATEPKKAVTMQLPAMDITNKPPGHGHPGTVRVNGYGYLDEVERLKAPPPPPPPEPRDPHEQFCNDIFNELDTNGNGQLDSEELQLLGSKLEHDPQDWSPSFAADLILVLDLDFNGEISFEEFWAWYKTVIVDGRKWDPMDDLDHTKVGNSTMPSYHKLRRHRANIRLQKAADVMLSIEGNRNRPKFVPRERTPTPPPEEPAPAPPSHPPVMLPFPMTHFVATDGVTPPMDQESFRTSTWSFN